MRRLRHRAAVTASPYDDVGRPAVIRDPQGALRAFRCWYGLPELPEKRLPAVTGNREQGAVLLLAVTDGPVELCFTPTCASWANPIEAHFGPLRQFTIADSHHPNHIVQTRALHAYLRWRNANTRHRDVLAAERRERARVRSEKGIRWGGRTSRPQPDHTVAEPAHGSP